MESTGGVYRTCLFSRKWASVSVWLLSWAGYLDLLSSAQTVCGISQTTRIRVENETGVGIVQAAVSCTGGGVVEVIWAGAVTLGEAIAVAEGTFLSVTGEDGLAEARGDGSLVNGTRLFEISPGGGLTLTQMKVSGGTARDGGAIYSSSATLTLDDCTFDGNVANDGDGGAVWAHGGNVTIVGGVFLGGNATRYGGGVYATDSWLVVQRGSRFEGNTAIGGGTIFCGLRDEGSDELAAYCSITEAVFVSNMATSQSQDDGEYYAYVYYSGGGAALFFLFVTVDITDSVFSGNHAEVAGGALHGAIDSNISVNGCTFDNNTTGGQGGAVSASSMTLGGGTELTNNFALDGGAVYGWASSGTISFSDVTCSENSAARNGGCFNGAGKGEINDRTSMLNNVADDRGCIYASEGSHIIVNGGHFTCQCTSNGAFLNAQDGAIVSITGSVIEGNTARRAAGVYCSGESVGVRLTIEGGTFRNNTSLELGGAIVAWGAPTVVTMTGGDFSNNTAKFYGGFIFLEGQASLNCKGALITGNYAGDQGGGIYAREATWVNSSCALIANESPQGAALYLTNVNSATFERHIVADNLASGGCVVYLASSTVVAREVTFESGVDLQEDSSNRAIQLYGDTTLYADGCIFNDWLGDTVIYHANSANASLVLDSCDFSGSSAAMAVISPHSNAEIRNAVVGEGMIASAVTSTFNRSPTLVDRALDCSDPNMCGAGMCVDSLLGVLCECLESGGCLHDRGELSLSLKTAPDNVTYDPDHVSYELVVSSVGNGTTNAIWYLNVEVNGLDVSVVPSSGVLPPGKNVTVTVTGTPSTEDVGGAIASRFVLTSVGTAGSSLHPDSGFKLEVDSMFYLCYAHEYAMPVDSGDDDAGVILCEGCATINGDEGVDCDNPGATRTSLPIREGFWRSDSKSMVIHECLHPWACKGGTTISSSDDYCAHRYKGPYCAVCIEGHGRSLSNYCHSCDGTKARLLIAACALFSLVMLLLLILAVVFLIGGLDAVQIVRQSTIRKLTRTSKASRCWRPVPRRRVPNCNDPDHSIRTDVFDETIPHGVDHATKDKRISGEVGVSFGGESTSQRCDRDELEPTHAQRLGTAVAAGDRVPLSCGTGRHTVGQEETAADRRTQRCPLAGRGVSGPVVRRRLDVETSGGMTSKCCVFGKTIIHRVQMLPLNKFKILVGVWQILAVFSSITGVEFPASYLMFLSWINVLNFDLGYIVSASCVLPSINFHQRLLATTIAPFAMFAGLVLTYRIAKGRAGIGSAGVIAKRAAWSRHLSAGLFITFVVFTSASSVVLNTFPCDYNVVDGESYLIADYSISCQTRLHWFFRAYAGIMILVYPIGIPVLYSFILWKHRELLNPRIHDDAKPDVNDATESVTTASVAVGDSAPSAIQSTACKGQSKNESSPLKTQELEERVKARAEHPELVPFMFLWYVTVGCIQTLLARRQCSVLCWRASVAFCLDHHDIRFAGIIQPIYANLYYYEVIECGRRIFLTDVLIFIAPHTLTQAAVGCIFAFVNLLVFELMRPHVDPTDSWLYRLGCVLIFLTMFLAMLIKMDVSGEANRSYFGLCLVAFNVFLVLAVSWFAMRHMGQISDEEDNTPS